MGQLGLFKISDLVTQGDIDSVRFKLEFDPSNVNEYDRGVIKYLLDEDRDFILAPEYGFSMNLMIDQRGPISATEVSKYMNMEIGEVYKVEKQSYDNVLKGLKLERETIRKKKTKKEDEMGKKGDRDFTEKTAMCFLRDYTKKCSVGDSVDLDDLGESAFKNNLKKAAVILDRLDGTVIDLKNIPEAKRGRPARDNVKEKEPESIETPYSVEYKETT